MPEISVIVPVYNMAHYLKNCIRSIQNQSYNDFEIIIVDDGSTDDSYQIAMGIAKEDQRVRIIHKQNEGVSVARNTGIDVANGKWIMFVDPDDTLEPYLISTLLFHINNEIDIVSCCCYAISNDKKEVNFFFSSNKTFKTFEQKKDLYKQLMNSHYGQPGVVYTAIGVPWGKIYRRSFLRKENLRFNPRLKRYQDNIFNMYAFFYARSILYLNQPLYDYKLEHIKKYSKMYKPGYADYMSTLCEERYFCMEKLGLLEDAELREFYCNEMLRHLWSIFRNDTFSPKNVASFKEEKRQANKLCQKKCFRPLLINSAKGFSFKDRVKLWIIKNRLFEFLPIVFFINNIKE